MLSSYHFGFNNPVRYSDSLGLMGQDAGIWGTGNTYASNNSQNPFDFMPKFTRTNPGSGNHWADDNIPGNPNDQAIRDYYLLSGSAFEKKYGAYQSNTVIIAGSLYVIWNVTRWKEYDWVANEKSYTYETLFTKANIQQSGGMQQNPLSQNSGTAVSLERFVAENSAFSMDQITTQRADSSWTFFRSQHGGPGLRYVNDPLNPGAVIDMRHMLIIGESGNFTGGLVELLQWSIFQSSGFNIQDFYSNNLGQYFYHEYGALLQTNPNRAAQYIGEFLSNPDFPHPRNPYNDFVK